MGTWEEFSVNKVKFLAIERDNGFSIVDKDCRNYGSWMSIKNFKKAVAAHAGDVSSLCVGIVKIQIFAL